MMMMTMMMILVITIKEVVLKILSQTHKKIHQVKTKKITTMKEVWIISIDFDNFPSPFTPYFLFRVRRYCKHSRQCFLGYPNTSNFVKNLRCASYFQLSSRCLDIPMKHCRSCLTYYFKRNKRSAVAWFSHFPVTIPYLAYDFGSLGILASV